MATTAEHLSIEMVMPRKLLWPATVPFNLLTSQV